MKSHTLIAIGTVAFLIGCGGPPPRVYVLGAALDARPGVTSEDTRPVVELARVTVPDYLDTTDISRHDGRNGIVTSRSGRWGERLSVGVARALAAALDQIVPSIRIARIALSSRPGRALLIEVETLEVRADGQCVLTANWTVLTDDRRSIVASGRGTFVTQIQDGPEDAAVVAAIGGAVEKLARPIAAALTRAAR